MDNKFDFNNNLDFLVNNKVNTSTAEKQDKVLNSKNYNKTFKCIEESLNLLYEKTRTMQDIIDYSNIFIRNEIDETVSECKSLLKNIESNRDLMKDSAYINYNIKLQSIFDTYSDRNNSPIKGVQMHNGVLTLNNSTIEDIELNNVDLETKSKNHNILNTKDDIYISKNYRTFYMFDRTQRDPIREKLIFNLTKVKTVNKIDIIPSNCKVNSIEYTLDNGQVEVVKDYEVNLFKNRNVKSIAINIECNNYMTSQVNYNEVKDDDFWEIVENIKKDENLIVDKKKYYYYLFGLDKIYIQFVDKSNKSCFISKELKIEDLKEHEYLALESEYMCENGNIEFSIIDGTTEKPILPESEKYVYHEKVFYKTPTRFTIEDINSIKVYEDGIPVKISLSEAMNDTNEKYTVSYKPKGATTLDSLLNNTIKVKALIRNYDNNYIPFIKSIQVKKYGGGTLWTDQAQI